MEKAYESWEKLAIAVCKQGIEDYRHGLECLAYNPKDAAAAAAVAETKSFFDSDWFTFLNPTRLTGKEVLSAIATGNNS